MTTKSLRRGRRRSSIVKPGNEVSNLIGTGALRNKRKEGKSMKTAIESFMRDAKGSNLCKQALPDHTTDRELRSEMTRTKNRVFMNGEGGESRPVRRFEGGLVELLEVACWVPSLRSRI